MWGCEMNSNKGNWSQKWMLRKVRRKRSDSQEVNRGQCVLVSIKRSATIGARCCSWICVACREARCEGRRTLSANSANTKAAPPAVAAKKLPSNWEVSIVSGADAVVPAAGGRSRWCIGGPNAIQRTRAVLAVAVGRSQISRSHPVGSGDEVSASLSAWARERASCSGSPRICMLWLVLEAD